MTTTHKGRVFAGTYARGGFIPPRGSVRGRIAYCVRTDGTVLFVRPRREHLAYYAYREHRLVWPTATVTIASPVRVRVDRRVITRTAQENSARAHERTLPPYTHGSA